MSKSKIDETLYPCNSADCPRQIQAVQRGYSGIPREVLDELAAAYRRNRFYGDAVAHAAKAVHRTLVEGESKYPNLDPAAIVNKSDHLEHALEHLHMVKADDTQERHCAHAITRTVLEEMRRAGKY